MNLEISKDNISVLEHTNRLLVGDNIESKQLIHKDASGYGATKKMNASKLDQLGDIKSHSHIANSKERLIQYKNHATLAASVAQLHTMITSNNR